jgi:hypothetical protein
MLESSSIHSSVTLDLQSLEFEVDVLGLLTARDGAGNCFENVRPVRLFPLSHPTEWISLIDATGREIVCVDDLSKLGDANQSILRRELEKREFVPIVKRIKWISGNSEPSEWKVETDRGETSFILKDENDVRRLGEVSVLVVDSFGIRYFVPDRNKLDAFSRRIIEWYV